MEQWPDMWMKLTQDPSSSETSAEVDIKVIEVLLAADDPVLIFDLRANNERHKNKAYDPFWDELQPFLDEQSVVNGRCHGEELHMPFSMSVQDLISQGQTNPLLFHQCLRSA